MVSRRSISVNAGLLVSGFAADVIAYQFIEFPIHSLWILQNIDQQAGLHASRHQVACHLHPIQPISLQVIWKSGRWPSAGYAQPPLSYGLRRVNDRQHLVVPHLEHHANGNIEKYPLRLHQRHVVDGPVHAHDCLERRLLFLHIARRQCHWRVARL